MVHLEIVLRTYACILDSTLKLLLLLDCKTVKTCEFLPYTARDTYGENGVGFSYV